MLKTSDGKILSNVRYVTITNDENGYWNGYVDGEEAGFEEGYSTGYDDGYIVGETQGYLAGEQSVLANLTDVSKEGWSNE